VGYPSGMPIEVGKGGNNLASSSIRAPRFLRRTGPRPRAADLGAVATPSRRSRLKRVGRRSLGAESKDNAFEAGRELKARFAHLQVKIFDAETKRSEAVAGA
jgi:hypothetical protein